MPTLAVCADGTAPHATIQSAIDAAPPGARIAICGGTYVENVVVEKPLTIEAAGPDRVVIDGGGEDLPALHARGVPAGEVIVVDVALENARPGARCDGATLVLRRITASRNRAGQGGGVAYVDCGGAIVDATIQDNQAVEGGGVAIVGGSVRIEGGVIANNRASNYGGGIYLEADATISGTRIDGNWSDNKGGGGFVYWNAPAIQGARFVGNTSIADGGALFLERSSATIVDTRFEANVSSSDDAGALRLHSATASVERCDFIDNRAAGDGGAVKASHDESRFVDVVFDGNHAEGNGGAIEVDDDQSTIVGSTFRRNRARRGGAIHGQFMGFGGGVFDSLIEDNDATERGGGVALEQNEGFVSLAGVTVRANRAERGAGISVASTAFDLRNSALVGNVAEQSGGAVYLSTGAVGTLAFLVLDGNQAPTGSAVRATGGTSAFDSSIVVGHAGSAIAVDVPIAWTWCDVWPVGADTFDGTGDPTGSSGNLSIDPMFAGDPYLLGAGSPLIDGGNPSFFDPDGTRADMGIHGGPDAR